MNFKEFESAAKLRGGYYTPDDLADFIAQWIFVKNPGRVLEPSCGDGVFFGALAKHAKNPEVRAFEIDDQEAEKAHRRAVDLGLSNARVSQEDFLGWAVTAVKEGVEGFDAVVGNPPFIRYQYLPLSFQSLAEEIFRELECKFTKHTNAWVPFILASMALLKPGGRLAMVVPAEIIHVTHAQSLRTYLGHECSRMVIIDPEEIWFEGTLQGAVILLAEKKTSRRSRSQGLGIVSVRDREFLQSEAEEVFRAPQSINGKTVEGKWTRALLDKPTLSLLDELCERDDVHRFDEIAQVDVGIVTGANKFFLVDNATVRRFKLDKWAHPMFGRSEHCPGIIYDEKQHEANAEKGNPTNFIWFQDTGVEGTKLGRSYIELGEEQNLHRRYKCRIRSPWYSVPSVYATEIGMLKRSHDTPRLILNRLSAFTTDTAYRVRTKTSTAEQLVYSFVNGLTALSAELEGRHYGGGVLELIPSEIERLLIPLPTKIDPDIIGLDRSVRTMPTNRVLECQSKRVLGTLGLSQKDQEELLSGWGKLRNRRHRVSTAA